MRSIRSFAASAGFLLVSSLCANGAGIYLEGSDAIDSHANGSAASPNAAQQYANNIFGILQGGKGLPVLVFSTNLYTAPYDATGVTYTLASDLTGINLADFSALLMDNDSLLPDFSAFNGVINSYVNSGGSLFIHFYDGSSQFDPRIGFTPAPGVTNVGANSGCYDNVTVTAAGSAVGINPIGYVGCWGHQDYDKSYFATQGFTSLVDTQDGTSGLLANTAATGVPEPATATLVFTALGLIAARTNRKRK